jgi:hypothetical protein
MYKQRFCLTYVNNMSESHALTWRSKRDAVGQWRKLKMMRDRRADVGEAGPLANGRGMA